MKVIIIGDGKMGYELANLLSSESHSVTVIDEKASALSQSSNTQDVICINGNGLDPAVLRAASVRDCDVVISTTAEDETNIICCLTAKKLGAGHTVARIRRPELTAAANLLRGDSGISMTVNPELAAAGEISRILRLPSAAKVDFFARGKVEMVEVKIPDNCPINGMPVSAIADKYHLQVLICAVQRDGEVHIPSGSFVLAAGDRISITAAPSTVNRFFHLIGVSTQGVRSVMIAGGGGSAYYLAQTLLDTGVSVKIFEPDAARATELSELLPRAMVIHGNSFDRELLREEGLEHTDALVALTPLDEENVVISMHALSFGVPKVITNINHARFGRVLDRAGIECVVTPHLIASNLIVRYVRAIQNSLGSNVEALCRIADNRVEALEFSVHDSFAGCGIPLRELKLKPGLLIACVIRAGYQLIFPRGSDTIMPSDSVIVVTTDTGLGDLSDILDR